ncbi:SMP-30/gluconolactonase/LRE family protein [Halobacillus sp. Marseille-Q1614]|uniref:SMP-30/gluconolactonase/LRE family protein n=1 Tax=Halobacillus sp. Marseille-Q1614 TaxID=2709134 RepID=UPI00157096F9|nr:SMP-30/gluconolactonase/LRE family protein [Halobacillus sp. Marseille-Q1614]
MNAELVVNSQSTLGEGPCWDPENQHFYWVDILEKKIHRLDTVTKEREEITLESYVGAAALKQNGGLIVALMTGLYELNWNSKSLHLIEDPESNLPGNRFNDGKCDPYGRFWAGTMDAEENKTSGALYCLDVNGELRKKIDNVGISNGITWSPDHKIMYFIDTPTGKVVKYDYCLKTGEISSPIPVITFPDDVGFPDGMTIDTEGMLWIAHYSGGGVSRWNPETGEQLNFISVPAVNVTSCTFGGKNIDELYVTTARKDMNEEQLSQYPYAGGVFKIKTTVKGITNFPYRGI